GPGGVIEVVSPLSLVCPSNIRIEDVAGTTRPVTFAPAMSSGGVAPVSVTCTPASGAPFPLGTTTVTCSGADAAMPARTAECQLTVTLAAFVPVLTLTKFLAFGDSITAGEINDDVAGC